MPFAYFVREPVASVASLLAPGQSVAQLLESPCLRWRGRLAWAQLPPLLARAATREPLSLTMEQYCAAHLSALHDAMSDRIAADGGLEDARRRSIVIDHAALPDVIAREVLPAFDFDVDVTTEARAREYGAVNAKDATKAGYRSKAASDAVQRWATAYAAASYERLRVLTAAAQAQGASVVKTALRLAEVAAAAALTNESAPLGRFAHTAGLGGSGGGGGTRSGRACAAHDEAARSVVGLSEHAMALYAAGDLFGAEACWLASLSLAAEAAEFASSADESAKAEVSRASLLLNLAMVEGPLSRVEPRRLSVRQQAESRPEAEALRRPA